MSKYCVIGSGISGATIANLLSKNYSVDLFDKARGPGGRSSFKRLDKAKGFDHGTQYISPKSLPFKKFVNFLIKKKILKKWSGIHLFLNKAKKENKSVFETGNYNPAKIFAIFFLVFFIFIFTKGVEVLTKTNSYSIEYEGPKKTTLERIQEFIN